ncbi:hypothetical protein UAJ10_19515 [Nitrospirillum sp. BR 11164]|uniref:hypothetical protein n=1 Tax=Nitrospirillum sp. BR 11164 TaxID=3104324 RepID=UPI002AFFDE0A|nr:hypothetical protein [Nitrospirillum sp. BR 11164]MEA1651202.1 hypothetical protein [Nitrospirillum sp. BR 11164]
MVVSTEDLGLIDGLLDMPAPADGVFADLRRHLPHLSWTRCDATDVAEEPFRRYPRFDLHLLDASDHCVRLTPDPAHATGVVLARRGKGA